ncbi:MAG: bile acid:sodium symporter [Candidatus Shapirobacteria bacterium]
MNFIRKNTWLLILIAIFISFLWPAVGFKLKPFLNYFLMGIMFLSCLDIDLKELKNSLVNFKKQAIIILLSQLLGPILVLFLRPFLSDELFLGLILASAIPVGRSSVFLSKILGGEATLPLVASSVSNALSPFTVPFLVFIFARTSIKIDTLQMGSTILWLVLVPIVAAVLVRMTGKVNLLIRESSNLSTLLLFLIIIGIIAPLRETILLNWQNSLLLMFFIAVLMLINFVIGWKIGKKKEEKIALAITASYKNYTLGTLVALSMFNPVVALPSIIYTITNNLMLIPIQFFVERKKSTPAPPLT